MPATPKNKDKKVRFTEPLTSSANTNTKTDSSSNIVSNKHVLPSTRVRISTSASGSQLLGNTKNDKIQRPPRSNLKNKVEAHPRKVKSILNNKNGMVKLNGSARNACPLTRITITTEVPSRKQINQESETPKTGVTLVYSRKPRKNKTTDSISKSKVVQIFLWYLYSGCSKHMTGDRSQLTNFVSKFLGTVKFGNDHVAKIMGYGDYHNRNVMISRVYYVEGLGHNLFSVGQFCDSNLEVAFRQHSYYIRNLEGVDLLTSSRGDNLYTLSLRDMMVSSPICLLSKASKTKSWLWHRRLSHLNFGPINHLARHGLVREAVATTCYNQNHSMIRLRHGKTPYELLHNKPPDLSFLHVIARIWGSYNQKVTLLSTMASEHRSLGPALHTMTPVTISSGLVPNPPPSTPLVPPSRND
ncbi:retrovirus-related pol polyprotein from transposon TNT 1-94 [Tanacetum coccineum]